MSVERTSIETHRVVLLLACAAFLISAWWHIELPGLQYDECMGASAAVNFVRGTDNAEPTQLRQTVIHPFGRPLPLMLMAYIGPIKTLLYLPIFALLGISPTTVRLLPTLAGLLSLILTYHICRRLFDRSVAGIAVLLLALDPSFVFYLTRDVGPSALQVLFKLLALALLLRWWQRGSLTAFGAGALALGLGISHKADFLWVVAGLVVPALILAPRELLGRIRSRTICIGLLGLLLGAWPLVAYNVASTGRTFTPAFARLLSEERLQPERLLANLVERGTQVWNLLDGDVVSRLFTEQSLPLEAARSGAPLALSLSLVGLVVTRFRGRRLIAPMAVEGLLIYCGVVFLATCFSPAGLSSHHLLILYPMSQVAIAIALVTAFPSGIGRIRTWIRTVALVAILLGNLTAVIGINRIIDRTGGSRWWSDAIYALNDDLLERGKTVALMDWGFSNNLIVLSKGALPMIPVYRNRYFRPVLPDLLERYLDEEWLYLFHTTDFTLFDGIHENFVEAAARRSYSVVEERRFAQRDGRDLYRLVRLAPKKGESPPLVPPSSRSGVLEEPHESHPEATRAGDSLPQR